MPSRPRILHCVSHLALGGAERVALTLVDALRGDFDFAVYAVRGLGDGEMGRSLARELEAQYVPLFKGPRIPMRFGGMISGAIGLSYAVRRFAPDIIHLHTEIPEASYATMLSVQPKLRRIPVVRTIHNAVFWTFWPSLGRWCDRRLASAYIVGVSSGSVAALQGLRTASAAPPPPEAPVVIYNGVTRPSSTAPRSFPADDAPFRVLFGGRLEDQKGADLLPAILAQATVPARRSAHLTIYGSGKYAPSLYALAQDPPRGWTVSVHPPTPDFRQQLGSFDVVIIPSRFEGLPLIAVEAALAGVPIIGTDALGLIEALPPAHPWIARAGDARDFAAKLSAALSKPSHWGAAADSARKFAEQRFSVDLMAAGYRALYGRALLNPVQPHYGGSS